MPWMSGQKSVFSIDVEDWFHILDVPSAPKIDDWGNQESRVEYTTHRLLDLFDRKGVKSPLFILAWVAERFPQLVEECSKRGHEIASHGYAHELVFEIGQERFERDIRKAKDLLEDIIGKAVLGYRAPGFSLTTETPWFFDTLAKVGYRYDSSLFPAPRNHGGIEDANPLPHVVSTSFGDIIEFPMSLSSFMNRKVYFFGGGYLRFFPSFLIMRKAKELVAKGDPVIFYLHPREVDPEHPRLDMSVKRRFMSYVNIKSSIPKMEKLFDELPMTTFEELIKEGVHLRHSA